eukprot:6373727-Pyramimonas_sp.AAC.1
MPMPMAEPDEFEKANEPMKDVFQAIWHDNVPGASQRAGETPRQYRARFREAFRTWAKSILCRPAGAHQPVE